MFVVDIDVLSNKVMFPEHSDISVAYGILRMVGDFCKGIATPHPQRLYQIKPRTLSKILPQGLKNKQTKNPKLWYLKVPHLHILAT